MEANICDIGNSDADAVLPLRKRLLAGFKKQKSDNNASVTPLGVASSSSSASLACSQPSPGPNSPSSSDYQSRLKNLLISHLNNNHDLSPEKILQASKSAADTALRAAEAARAASQEKALVAVHAVRAAKTALALVALFPQEATTKERNLKKNKLKKHVQLQLLYKKHRPVENFGDDGAVARKLHRVINSSPRKKKLKSSPTSNGSTTTRGGPSSNDGNSIAGECNSKVSKPEESSQLEVDNGEAESSQLEVDNGEAESSRAKEKMFVDAGLPSKRRGRLNLKKLPLSTFSSRDQENPKDDRVPRSLTLTGKNTGEWPGGNNKPLHSVEPSEMNSKPIDVSSMRKCQESKSAACVKQLNKAIQS